MVTLWHPFTSGVMAEGMREVIDDFNRLQNQYVVVATPLPWAYMDQKFLTAMVGGVPPDLVMQDDMKVAKYATRHAIQSFDSLIDEGRISPAAFDPAAWSSGVYKGKLYSLPLSMDLRVLFYNKAWFREVGLDPSKPPQTWEDLWDVAERFDVRGEDGRFVKLAFEPLWGNSWLYLYGWQMGGEFLSADGLRATCASPEIVKALTWITSWTQRYGLENLKAMESTFGPLGEDPFMLERVAMIVNCYSAKDHYDRNAPDLEYGMAEPPYPQDGRRATWTGVWIAMLPTGGRNPEGARAFLEYAMQPDVQVKLALAWGYVPARIEALEHPLFQDDFRTQMLAVTRTRPVTPAGNFLWFELARATDRAIYGQAAPQESLDDARANTQNELDRLQRMEARRRRAMREES